MYKIKTLSRDEIISLIEVCEIYKKDDNKGIEARSLESQDGLILRLAPTIDIMLDSIYQTIDDIANKFKKSNFFIDTSFRELVDMPDNINHYLVDLNSKKINRIRKILIIYDRDINLLSYKIGLGDDNPDYYHCFEYIDSSIYLYSTAEEALNTLKVLVKNHFDAIYENKIAENERKQLSRLDALLKK